MGVGDTAPAPAPPSPPCSQRLWETLKVDIDGPNSSHDR